MTDPSQPTSESKPSGDAGLSDENGTQVHRKARVEIIEDQAGQRIDNYLHGLLSNCLLYTSDAADESSRG